MSPSRASVKRVATILVSLAAVVGIFWPCWAQADTITVLATSGSSHWTSSTLVWVLGGNDQGITPSNAYDGATDTSVQYTWVDINSLLLNIPAGTLQSATLTFNGAGNYGAAGTPPDFSAFAAVGGPGSGGYGWSTVSATDPASYYTNNAHSTGVTGSQLPATGFSNSTAMNFDITALVQTWQGEPSYTSLRGQLMILGDADVSNCIVWGDPNHGGYAGSTPPTISVTTSPEPGTLVILVTALLSLICYAWRKQR